MFKLLQRGFTLTEVLVVIALVAMLSSILYVNFNDAGGQARDAQRQADLRNLQTAIEAYKSRYGKYPEGCAGAGQWSKEQVCPGNYIKDLVPEFLTSLPHDPKLNGTNSGYMYISNAGDLNPEIDGTSYKIIAYLTVESEEFSRSVSSEFKSCDVTSSNSGVCDVTYRRLDDGERANWNNPAPHCIDGYNGFVKSYGLWGGYPKENWSCPHVRCEEKVENIICRMP